MSVMIPEAHEMREKADSNWQERVNKCTAELLSKIEAATILGKTIIYLNTDTFGWNEDTLAAALQPFFDKGYTIEEGSDGKDIVISWE